MRKKIDIRLTIGMKLVGLIGIVLIGSIASLVWLSSRMFIEENTSLIQKTNSDLAQDLSREVRDSLEGLVEKMQTMGMLLQQDFPNPADREKLLSARYVRDKDFLGISLYENGADGKPMVKSRSVSPELAHMGDEKGDLAFAAVEAAEGFSVSRMATGEIQMAPVQLRDDGLALALGIPFIQSPDGKTFTHSLVAVFRASKFTDAFGKSEVSTIYLVDGHGKLMAHPDTSLLVAHKDFSGLEIVRKMTEGKASNGELRYPDPVTGQAELGAFHLVGFNGLGVIAQVPLEKALEPVRRVEYRSLLIGCAVLFLAFLAGYLYSRTISWPIQRLVEVARRISAGDFDIRIKPGKSRDEIAHLSLAFNEMAQGLAERDRVKETFNKFHSKEVAEKILSGTVKLGGSRQDAVVFFSDIRGFTAMSERVQPEVLVRILNAYMTEMVRVITRHGGIIDKYVGDAIMAIWGIPEAREGDCDRAIRACLEMRKALKELNERFKQQGLPELWIGMGLNYGSLISGNIGSEERMEFTVIGDTVNTASRVESLTKEFGTDLLVSAEVLRNIKARYLCQKVHETMVKGKKEPLAVYKVGGYVAENGQQVLVETPYSSYQPSKSDKVAKHVA